MKNDKPKPLCEHDGGNVWLGGVTGYISKAMYETCPLCKPTVEPSVVEILRDRIKELEGRLIDQAVAICEMSKVFAKKIAELERKE